MNIYQVTIDSEKTDDGYCDIWTIESTKPGTAIRKVLNRTKHVNAVNIEICCELIVRNKTYKEYKAAKGKEVVNE